MPNMTLSIPEELHKKMKKMSEIRWSEVARRAIEERALGLTNEDKEAISWSVRFQRASRTKRLDELKKKGLI